MKKHLNLIIMVLLGIVSIVFLTLFVVENKQNNNLQTELTEMSGTLSAIVTFDGAIMEFTIETSEYIDCLRKAMRGQHYFTTCDDMYELYRDSWNILYDNNLVEFEIYDI